MKIVFSDFDGTLTLDHSVTPTFMDVLELLKKHNCEFVIVSGRSLSWGHFFLTHFSPVTAVIMEGGGVLVTRKGNGLMEEKNLVSDKELLHLETQTAALLKNFPWLSLTKDSFGRRTDRAIELIEYDDHQKEQIMKFLKTHDIHYSASNVHINFWAGTVSKYKAVDYYLSTYRPMVDLSDCLYFGDAPNDESMFQYFENSVGPSNIDSYLPLMTHHPKIILKGEENKGVLGVYSYLQQVFKK
ncbi:MAG: HAD family hydrolase [Bacteriovoracaceae bacterium]